ncbi:phosphoribosylanthranilate isomerase [Mucilaginibacter myungsuensis]|uniref:N-(5'-phosphoribosyl)anthranilate isomerase n=1 Tax=Mucilaginibacter myungsuensis TaxID=649104 RepID=A0A929KSK0_9SPHI|nr:phosphoribosylanthranilate isomerase [Mucilaginibacter myungsuensis]MBE9660746.1 phosphoribosylanthranilate isomerase [Mucilaginibacter myungsuensis]MDN3600791.1 phosphoribosylanthranilate isomerase [Mucilaginibacter myungsuensis]
MRIKVCGLKYTDNIATVAGLQPDYVGFIRYERSPRFVDELPEETLIQLPSTIKKTGVFVNEDPSVMEELIGKYNFEAIQLHGNESPEFCAQFKGRVEVLKAFGVDEEFDFEQLDKYADHVDYFLFDTKTAAHGGSGQSFDWSVLDNYKLDVPFFLSGGLSLDNIAEVKNIKHPAFYGVDLNSKFEIEPGLKDIDKLKQAFALLNNI